MIGLTKRGGVWLAVVMTVMGVAIILYILYRSGLDQLEYSRESIINGAHSHLESIKVLRRWNANHGGVFVYRRKGLDPNPYLKDNHIYAADGREMVKINPSWMTRQLGEYFEKGRIFYYRMSSLNPINPINKPDSFERRGLELFEKDRNVESHYEFETDADGQYVLHFIGRLVTEEACLQCHAQQGYRVGDIRGGVRITVPAESYLKAERSVERRFIDLGLLITISGGIFILVFIRMFRGIERRESEIVELNESLERRVEERSQQIRKLYEREESLLTIVNTIADVNKLIIQCETIDEILKKSCDRLASHRDYRLAWIGFVEDKRIRVSYRSDDPTNYLGKDFIVSLDPGSPLSIGPASRSVREGRTVLVNDIKSDPIFEPWRERARVSGLSACIAIPLRETGQIPFGTLLVYSGHVGGFESQEIEMLEELAGDLSFAIRTFERDRSLRKLEMNLIRNYEDTIFAFVNMIELRDSYTAGHSSRVSVYSGMIAEKMGFAQKDVEKLTKAGILHDIGKIVTPDSVLLNPGRLTDLEYDLIKQHAIIGYEFLSRIEMYSDLAEIIRYHHERYDGNGYPSGISGDDIPILSSIMAVADAFDAMTTERIYKPRITRDNAIVELQRLSGLQFHPEIVKYAITVFENIDIPKNVTQLPLTYLERKRFSYFFNDKLTGLFNDEYLKIVLNSETGTSGYSHIYMIMLREFSKYNHNFGWNQGNELLKEIASWLTLVYPETMAFRVKGDIFAILTGGKLVPDPRQIVDATQLKNSGVRVEIHSVNMRENPGYWPDFLAM